MQLSSLSGSGGPARLSQASCTVSPSLWERLEGVPQDTRSAKPNPGHFPAVRVSSAVSVTRAGTRCGAVTLLRMLSTRQGQPWQPAATFRSTQQPSFPNRLLQQLRSEPVPKGGVVGQWQDPRPKSPSKHHFFTYKWFCLTPLDKSSRVFQ